MNSLFRVFILLVSCLLVSFDTPVLSSSKESYKYVQDGSTYSELNIPTYEWVPFGFKSKPKGIVLMVHGLTLHGKTYDLMGKAFASANYYAVSFDMRGFGRCFKDENNKFSKKKVDYEESYEDMVALVKLAREKFPDTRFIAIGESLGATPCLKLAAQYPELVDGLILSGPAIVVNPKMLIHPKAVFAGLRGLVIDPKFNVNLNYFMRSLVSLDERIVSEMEDDPLVRKQLTVRDLIKTSRYVRKNVKYGQGLKPDIPLLILQGSKDNCVVPKSVVKLLNAVKSNDQTLRWMEHLSHLLLETRYIKPDTVNAINGWIEQHEEDYLKELEELDEDLKRLGALAL